MITITRTTLPNATVNQVYPSQTITYVGTFVGTLVFTALGQMPNGMILSTNGILSGTPSIEGAYDIAILATDSSGATTRKNISLMVTDTSGAFVFYASNNIYRAGSNDVSAQPQRLILGTVGNATVSDNNAGGTLELIEGYTNRWAYTPLNQTKSITFTASGSSTVNKSVQVYSTFPLQPNYSYEVNLDNKTLVSTAEDGSSVYRLKGMFKRNWNLNFSDRPFTEYQLLYNFWLYHQKHIKFYYSDYVFDDVRLTTMDSGLRIQASGPDRISMTCVLKEN